jgi:hypothetical protein
MPGKFNVGQLVKWHELYADGDLVKDTGYGKILKKNTYEFGYESGPYTNYRVCRYKHVDILTFSEHELEGVKTE